MVATVHSDGWLRILGQSMPTKIVSNEHFPGQSGLEMFQVANKIHWMNNCGCDFGSCGGGGGCCAGNMSSRVSIRISIRTWALLSEHMALSSSYSFLMLLEELLVLWIFGVKYFISQYIGMTNSSRNVFSNKYIKLLSTATRIGEVPEPPLEHLGEAEEEPGSSVKHRSDPIAKWMDSWNHFCQSVL